MEYFYADQSNQAKGPISEAALRNLYFQQRISLSTPVIVASAREWSLLRDCCPDLEGFRGCPKCFKQASIEDRICPDCRFPIAQYNVNLSTARRRRVQCPEIKQAQIDTALRTHLAGYNSANSLGASLVVAVIVCFIPIIGLFLGVLAVVIGIALMISPVGMKLWWLRNFDRENLAKIQQTVVDRLTSPFIGTCPQCNHRISKIPELTSLNLTCPACHSSLQYQNSYIYFVPYPNAVTSSDFDRLFVGR